MSLSSFILYVTCIMFSFEVSTTKLLQSNNSRLLGNILCAVSINCGKVMRTVNNFRYPLKELFIFSVTQSRISARRLKIRSA